MPTLREGFPNVVLEAASAGIPTITTRATGAIDSVVEGRTGYLIDIDDSEALLSRMNHLAEDAERLLELGQNAKRRAEIDFRPEIIWEGLLDIFDGNTQSSRLRKADNRHNRSKS